MDAEMIRDSALWIGGRLVETRRQRGQALPASRALKAVAYPSSSTANFVRDDGDALSKEPLYVFSAVLHRHDPAGCPTGAVRSSGNVHNTPHKPCT